MPNTCCNVQPRPSITRRAASGTSLAPPTCSTCRLDRSCAVVAAACAHSNASGGTRPQQVTCSRAISGNAASGPGPGLSTTRAPAYSAPKNPGELIGKLCAAGSATRCSRRAYAESAWTGRCCHRRSAGKPPTAGPGRPAAGRGRPAARPTR
ncbi:hypothetical protein G6F56_013675 [Rhizopus delemar]|nr:hypothetical protein G6F56_013675 [Rhizopus delemar]